MFVTETLRNPSGADEVVERTAVNDVPVTFEMDSTVTPSPSTASATPCWNPVPVTVTVRPAAPRPIVDGAMPVTTGPSVTSSASTAVAVPVSRFVTVMARRLRTAVLVAASVTVISVLLMKATPVTLTSEPLTATDAPVRKPEPAIVITRLAAPCATVAGVSEVMVTGPTS